MAVLLRTAHSVSAGHEPVARQKATEMLMHWIGTLARTKTLRVGFQPTAGYAGTISIARPAVAPAPNLGLMSRLDRWFWSLEQKRRDAYLAQAVDIVDLEQRMRRLERAPQGFLIG